MADTTSNLIGHWKFDEGSGSTANDSGSGNNDGTISGASWAAGRLGTDNALSFDGVDDYVSTGAVVGLANSGALTIAAWVYCDTVATGAGANTIAAYYTPAGYAPYSMSLESDNEVNLLWTNSDGTANEVHVSNDDAIATGVWQHLAAVRVSADSVILYKDGAARGSTQFNAAAIATGTDGRLDIGGFSAFGLYFFDGRMQDVRVYDRALSADDVAKLYLTTGTASFTEPNETLSSSTLVAVAGVGSFTEPNESLTGVGSVTVIGSADFTEPVETLSSSVAVTWYAVADFTEPDETLSSDAAVAVVGAVNVTDPAAETLSSAIAVAVVATAEFTEANETLSSEGTVSGGAITADAAFTEPNETLSSDALVVASASLAGTEANEALTGVGTVAVVATAEFTEPNETLSSDVVGTLVVSAEFTEPNETLSGAAAVAVDASMAATEANETLSSAAAVAVSASMTATEANETLSSAGLVVIIGTANFTEPGEQLSSLVDTGTGFVYGSQRRISIGVGVGL